jgi:4-aminobutyrate aminotransferase-like enzyme
VFNLKHPSCGFACVRFIEDYVFARHTPPEDVAAVFVEPIQGEGGYVVPPAGYFEELQALCRRHDILLVVDEVQSGMGRTGKWWAIQHWNATPDVMTIAKGIASGLPLGITVASSEIMSWPPGSHGNTFGGNPVSCASALATLDLIEERLLDNARFRRGLLLLGAGPSAIRFCPPLVLSRREAQIGLEILEDSIAEVEKRGARHDGGARARAGRNGKPAGSPRVKVKVAGRRGS